MSAQNEMIADMAGRLFGDLCDQKALDAAEAAQAVPDELWAAFEASGLGDLLTGEGEDAPDASDFAAVARAAGKAGAPIPVVQTIVGRKLLADAGIAIPSGPLALSIDGLTGNWAIGDTLSGGDPAVSWAGALVVVVGGEVILMSPDALAIRADRNIAGEPRSTVSADGAPFVARGTAPGNLAVELLALGTAARAVGASERVLELAIDYVTTRVQFGKPLSNRQAIQQQIAEMASSIAAAATITEAAARAIGREDAGLLVAAARARLADTIDRTTGIAHQVSGALGFSREYLLNHFTRRLWAWRDEAGSASHWRLVLGNAFAGTASDDLWPALAAVGAAR